MDFMLFVVLLAIAIAIVLPAYQLMRSVGTSAAVSVASTAAIAILFLIAEHATIAVIAGCVQLCFTRKTRYEEVFLIVGFILVFAFYIVGVVVVIVLATMEAFSLLD